MNQSSICVEGEFVADQRYSTVNSIERLPWTCINKVSTTAENKIGHSVVCRTLHGSLSGPLAGTTFPAPL